MIEAYNDLVNHSSISSTTYTGNVGVAYQTTPFSVKFSPSRALINFGLHFIAYRGSYVAGTITLNLRGRKVMTSNFVKGSGFYDQAIFDTSRTCDMFPSRVSTSLPVTATSLAIAGGVGEGDIASFVPSVGVLGAVTQSPAICENCVTRVVACSAFRDTVTFVTFNNYVVEYPVRIEEDIDEIVVQTSTLFASANIAAGQNLTLLGHLLVRPY